MSASGSQNLVPGTRVLVTGGAGFIGCHLVAALLRRECRVSVIDDLSTGRFDNLRHLQDHPGFSFVRGRVTHQSVLDPLVRAADAVFHLAAAVGVELVVRDPVRALESNVLGMHAVIEAAHRHRRQLFFTSTSEVYGKGNTELRAHGFAEDDDCVTGPTTKARWGYAASKAVGEHLGLAYHRQKQLPVVIFRLFNTVGPRQRGRYGMVIPRLVSQALTGQPLTVYGDGAQRRCFCDVEDVVRGILALAEHPLSRGKIFNVGSTREISILELAHLVLEIAGVPAAERAGRIRFVPYSEVYGPGFEDMHRRRPAIDRIRDLTGWQPRIDLEETLRRIVEAHPAAGAERLAASTAS